MVPVAQFGKTWAVTFRFKPFPVAQRDREKRERKKERKGLGDMSDIPLIAGAGGRFGRGNLA